MISTPEAADLQEAGIGAFFRPRDLAPLGISHRKLQGLVSRGVVENFGNGLYRLTEVCRARTVLRTYLEARPQ